jgi:choline dehydrogenase-like flavoprotein
MRPIAMSCRYDYIVIGSGAGGAAAAWRLAQTGRRVLVLEKGSRLPTDGSTLDVDLVIRQQRFSSKEPWCLPDGRVIVPREYFNIGGKTKWSGAALVRFQPNEFEIDPEYGCRAWPITYEDLASYYTEAERLLDARCFNVEPDLQQILDRLYQYDCAWQLHPLPLGLAPQIFDHVEEVRRFDGGFASARGLKSDAETCLLDRLKDFPQVKIRPAKEVTELEPAPGEARRIAAVSCTDGSRYEADTVVLAAGALHSPRLLQRYLRRAGAALSSPSFDHVGRYYKRRLNSVVIAVSPGRVVDLLRKTVILYHSALPHSSVQPIGWIDGDVLDARLSGLMPRFVANAIGARTYAFWLSTEDGSSANNRVIDANGSAHPVLDYDPARLPAAQLEHRRLQRAVRRQLLRLGHLAFVKEGSIQSTAYACGTLAAGDCAATSVVAADGRVHALDNLYVVDGSALPRSGRVNPALTIYAWALRVADLLAARPHRQRTL